MYLESEIDENDKYYSWDEKTGDIDYNDKWTIEDVKKIEKRIIKNFKVYASDETLFNNSLDPEEIRKHMIKSISTVSKIN